MANADHVAAWRLRNPEKARAQTREAVRRYRASGRARDQEQREAYQAADRRLRNRHRGEWEAIYNSERVIRGLNPTGGQVNRAKGANDAEL